MESEKDVFGTCRQCGEEKKLIDSHIIPKWCFKYLYPNNKIEGESLIMIDGLSGIKRKSRTGIYEKLLCSECDNSLGYYDDYGKQIFVDKKPVVFPGTENGLLFENIDSKRIKLFLLSLLWRTSISSNPMFSKISLGPFEEKLKSALLDNDFKKRDNFSIIVTKYRTGAFKELSNKTILNPATRKINHINFCCLRLPNAYEVLIKVDKREIENQFKVLTLKDDDKMIVLLRENYEDSPSFRSFVNTVKNLNKR